MHHQSPKQGRLNSLPGGPVFLCWKGVLDVPKFWSCVYTQREEWTEKAPCGLIYLYFVLAPDIWKRLEDLINVCYFWFALEDARLTAESWKIDSLFYFWEVQGLRLFSQVLASSPRLWGYLWSPPPPEQTLWIDPHDCCPLSPQMTPNPLTTALQAAATTWSKLMQPSCHPCSKTLIFHIPVT